MDPRFERDWLMTRRSFFRASGTGIGFAALATLLSDDLLAAAPAGSEAIGGLAGFPNFAPKAKRVIYLNQTGAPSHLDLWDYKPILAEMTGKELPESARKNLKQTQMTSTQFTLPVIGSKFKFAQYGQTGTWVSELLPHTAKIVDDICVIKGMWTDQVNHDPAITKLFTGFQVSGRPPLGAWVSYALGSENTDLPAFIVMPTGGAVEFLARHYGSGWLPPRYAGVKFGAGPDPVLYLSDPEGVDRASRRRYLDDLAALNQAERDRTGDPEIEARISQYEMAARMQLSVPELTDFSKEPESTFQLYGEDARKRGTFAANCLLARRLAERNVRFIMLNHGSWDHHANLPTRIVPLAREIDQGSAALVQDLKQRGLLDDTLVVWGGEFGRTVYGQYTLSGAKEATADNYGRDHNPSCYTMWMTGGGIKRGITYGETDDFSTTVVKDAVSVHNLQATILHCLGIDHTRLTYKYQGRNFRLTDVEGEVLKGLLA
jgi:hypothetical protein